MAKSLSLFIARRYITKRKTKGFSSFISASSTIGIALGVMILILVLSAMNGFERALSQHLLSVIPHAELVTVNKPIANWQKQIEQANSHPKVIAAAPVIKMQGMLQLGNNLKGVEIRGVDAELETQVSAIPNYITQGLWQNISQDGGIVIGSGIAKKLGLKVGDSAQLLLPPMRQITPENAQVSRQFNALVKRNVTVVGIYQFGGEIDNLQVFTNLSFTQQLLEYQPDQIQTIRLTVDQVFNAPRIAREVAYQLDSYVYIYDWTHTQGHLYNDIQLVRMVMFIVLVLVIAVASFNIVSTLIMAVNDKKGDIAILKTMGAKSSTIMLTFMLQGLNNGVVGTIVGGILGTLLSINLTEAAGSIERLLGVQFLSADVYFIDFLPTEVHTSDIVVTVITALTLTIIATLYPAWRATKIEPAQVLGQV